MRILLGELAPVLGEPARNAERISAALAARPSDLAVFPELYLSGYRVGDRAFADALGPDHPTIASLGELAERRGTEIVVGAPWRSPDRPGEVWNAAVLVGADRTVQAQPKRYLPTFGPFEEGVEFAATGTGRPVRSRAGPIGLSICYDAFFPEVARDLAMAGATLLVVLSAAPVTSRRLFERILPARAIENALPLVYVNRVGVEEGLVFGGGSIALDARGEVLEAVPVELPGRGPEERLLAVDIDLEESARWRRFRPVLRDLAERPAPPPSAPNEAASEGPDRPAPSIRAWSL